LKADGSVDGNTYVSAAVGGTFGGDITAAGLINSAVTEHADNAAAVSAGLATGTHYRTGDLLKIVH
jgi:hypothetical protein